MDKRACRFLMITETIKGFKLEKVSSLFQEVRDAVLEESVPLETALQVITSNPAKVLKLANKGHIQPGKDADLVPLDKDTNN